MRSRFLLSTLLAATWAAPITAALAMQAGPQMEQAALAPIPNSQQARQRVAEAWRKIASAGFSGAVRMDVGDETMLRAAAGFADPSTRRPYTPDTQFQIGSLTKAFTAAAILRLQDEGRLSVHDPLSRFFPDLPADKAGVTLHHLLIHAGGWGLAAPSPSRLGDLEPVGKEEYLRRAFSAPLLFEPGARLEYSNVGYSLLAAVIEQVTGGSYIDYLRATQLDPLGLKNTGYLEALAPDAVRSADGRDIVACCWAEGGPYWNLLGNGGLMSTLDDFVAWRKAFAKARLFSPEGLRMAETPWISEGDPDRGGEGYGWMIGNSPTRGSVQIAAGGNGHFVTEMRYYPGYDLTVVVTSNSGISPGDVSSRLIRALFGESEPTGEGTVSEHPAVGLARRFGEMLLNPDQATRHAFVHENAGPVFVDREGMPQIITRFDEQHRLVAGGSIISVELANPQRVEIVFSLPDGRNHRVAMNIGGSPQRTKFAGFYAME